MEEGDGTHEASRFGVPLLSLLLLSISDTFKITKTDRPEHLSVSALDTTSSTLIYPGSTSS